MLVSTCAHGSGACRLSKSATHHAHASPSPFPLLTSWRHYYACCLCSQLDSQHRAYPGITPLRVFRVLECENAFHPPGSLFCSLYKGSENGPLTLTSSFLKSDSLLSDVTKSPQIPPGPTFCTSRKGGNYRFRHSQNWQRMYAGRRHAIRLSA
jgi:hypothetical protein